MTATEMTRNQNQRHNALWPWAAHTYHLENGRMDQPWPLFAVLTAHHNLAWRPIPQPGHTCAPQGQGGRKCRPQTSKTDAHMRLPLRLLLRTIPNNT